MDPALIGWIIKLVSGAVGGNVAGAAMKDKSLGVLGNSVAGISGWREPAASLCSYWEWLRPAVWILAKC